MSSNLDDFLFHLGLNSPFMPKDIPTEFFHYTSPSGLLSILGSATIWASRYDCLNDISEGTLALPLFRNICSELHEAEVLPDNLYRLFYEVFPASHSSIAYIENDSYKATLAKCDRYVVSFSSQKDSLAMWNYYAKGSKYEGYNIGFNCFLVRNSLYSFFSSKKANFEIYPVVYHKSKQKELIRLFLLELIPHYSKEEESVILNAISEQLAEWNLIFKSEYFQHESEIRIIINVAKGEDKIPIQYHTSAGFLVPHIELTIGKEAVASVTAGPLQGSAEQQEHQIKVLEEYLQMNNYDSAFADHSKIPIRY